MPDWNNCDSCSPECPVLTEAGPVGPSGTAAAAGADGVDGVSVFTLTTAAFVTPAISSNVTIAVSNSVWMATGQSLFIEGAGTYEVVMVPSVTTVQVKNSGSTGAAVAGVTIGSGAKVVSSGRQGEAGAGVTFPISIAHGGTGAITSQAAIDALSPLAAKGNLLGHDGTHNAALPVGTTTGHSLLVDPAEALGLKWGAVNLAGAGVSGILPTARGGLGVTSLPQDTILIGNGVNPIGGITCNFSATSDPTVADDENDGWVVGSRWFNVSSGEEWLCMDPTLGAAIWKSTTSSPGSSYARRVTTNSMTVADTDTLICVTNSSTAAPKVMTLLDGDLYSDHFITVKDEGTASDPSITIEPNGSQQIENAANYTITVKGGSVTFYWTGTQWRIVDVKGQPTPLLQGGTANASWTASRLVRVNAANNALENVTPLAAIADPTPAPPGSGAFASLSIGAAYSQSEVQALRALCDAANDTLRAHQTAITSVLARLRVTGGIAAISN